MVIDGQRQLFESAIQPHLSDGFGLARFLTKNRADAEDIVQQASIRALRAVDSMREQNPRAWFLTIVRNTAYTWLVKRQQANFVLIDADARDEDNELSTLAISREHSVTPESLLIERANAAAIESAIRSLPESFREVVVLRDLQGFSYREVSIILDAPVGTVMSRLARARKRLIQQLAINREASER